MPTPVDSLLHDSFEIYIELREEPLLGLFARALYREFPESVVE
jgi:hypothetical protein